MSHDVNRSNFFVRGTLFAAVAALLFCEAPPAHAQCDFDLTSYPHSDLHFGPVQDMVFFDDGTSETLVLGGADLLSLNGGLDDACVVKWDPQRLTWNTLATQNNFYYVSALGVHNKVLFAGTSLSPRIYRYNGTTWNATTSTLPGPVNEFVEFDDLSGNGPALFAAVHHQLMKYQDDNWQTVASFDNIVRTLAVYNNQLVAAGAFTSIDGQSFPRIAAWNGNTWSALAEGMISGTVMSLATGQINGVPTLVAGGKFSQVDDKALPAVATWNGRAWTRLPVFVASSWAELRNVGTVTVWDRGDGAAVIAALNSESYDSGDSRDTLYRFNAATNSWDSIAVPSRIPHSAVTVLRPVFENPGQEFATLFIGGWFDRVYTNNMGTSVSAISLARLNPLPESTVSSMPRDPRAVRGDVNSLAVFDAGEGEALYGSGTFNDTPQPNISSSIARYTGNQWVSVARGSGVLGLATLDIGNGPTLYAYGSFTNLIPSSAQPRYVARFDGELWHPVGNFIGNTQRTVVALATFDVGNGPELYAVLSINNFPNPSVISVWNWSAVTTGWSPVNNSTVSGGGTFGPTLKAMVSFDDGSGPALYVAGRFDAIGGMPAKNIARWRGPNVGWSTVGEGMIGEVARLHVHADAQGSRLIASGTYVGGNTQYSFSQWDGTTWSTVGDPRSVGVFGTVRGFATFDDGSGPALIVSGNIRTGRWDGERWSLLPGERLGGWKPMGQTLFKTNPFGFWQSRGSELAIISQTTGSIFPTLGQNHTILQVQIQHGGAATFQWFRNNMPLTLGGQFSGVFAERLVINNINGSFEGTYHVEVSNDCTTITSEPIVVDVAGTCVGDVTADNVVNTQDLLAVITGWGTCPAFSAPCPGDLTLDRLVSVADMLQVLQRWGTCD